MTLDDDGHAWGAAAGTIWLRGGPQTRWQRAWSDERWQAPIVSLMAEGHRVLAVSVDGGLVEGTLNA